MSALRILRGEMEMAARATGAELDRVCASWRFWNLSIRNSPVPVMKLRAAVNGERPVYPASVSKLFFLLAAQAAYESGALEATPELDRALADMITVSGNDATHLVVDALTGTTGGVELPAPEMALWLERRQALNRYFRSLDWPEFEGITIAHKTYAEGPYGREKIARGPDGAHGNRLTTEAVGRLIFEIATGRAVTPERSAAMLALMERDPKGHCEDPPDQVRGFFGEGLPEGARLWSKAGWTSETRHDAAYVELPEGPSFILVAFTTGREMSANKAFLPELARRIAAAAARRSA
jgi:beta-lactamase class A